MRYFGYKRTRIYALSPNSDRNVKLKFTCIRNLRTFSADGFFDYFKNL